MSGATVRGWEQARLLRPGWELEFRGEFFPITEVKDCSDHVHLTILIDGQPVTLPPVCRYDAARIRRPLNMPGI